MHRDFWAEVLRLKKNYEVIQNDNIKKDPKEREYDWVQWFYTQGVS